MLIRRVHRVFLRYEEINLSLDQPGADLRDGDGRMVGRVTALRVRAGRLILEGTATADALVLRLGAATHPAAPDPATGAFRLDVPFQAGPMMLLAEGGAGYPFGGVTQAQLARARWWLAARFLRTLLRLTPQIWRWKRGGDLGAREEVKEALNLVAHAAAAVIDGTALTAPLPPPDPGPVTIVMPVHNAFDMTREALARVARHSGQAWHLVAIEDASTDGRVRPWLQSWAAEQGARVTVLEQDANLGFIGSANRGFEVALRHGGAPVVLLNSDAMVPADWLPRLLAPLADPTVASVTPLSNDAELFTVPVICARHPLRPGQGDALDAVARDLGPGAMRPELPTGVGFCMALAPRFLAKLPEFDTVFGRGYGEEVDWCRKAMALGGRHVCAQDLFVEHRGGGSFGQTAKQRLLERNGAVISRRYPHFDGEVQAFLRADPLTTPRLALALSWAALSGEVPVFLAHALGGGAESWLQARLDDRAARGGASVVLRVGQRRRWRLEVHGPHGVTAGLTDDVSLVERLISRLPARRIIYSCGVGHPEAVALPEVLLRLATGGHPVEVLVHDFFPISPSYTLLDADGTFRGVPRPGATDDPAHRHLAPGGGAETGLVAWQTAWGHLIDQAERVVTFSEDSRVYVLRAYPQAQGKIDVTPHALRHEVPAIPPPVRLGGGPVIGVLGNIGPHKGAAVLQRLSRALAGNDGGCLVLLGHLAPEYTLAAPSRVHGAYRLEDLPELVGRYGIEGWFMPSIWPETFSFTTHEMLATGLPVAAFDLGAQGEAVRAAANGHLLPHNASAEDALALWRALRDMLPPGEMP